MLDFRRNRQQFHWRDKEKEVLTKDVSKSCHMRPIRCLRPQIFMGWLEMWRHFILGTYSAFLLGSPTFNAVTSSKLTSACCERTALHFCQCSEFAFQALSCLLHLSVPCFCLSQLLQSLYCFKIAKIYLCPQSCHWSDATKLLFCSVLYNKRLYQMKTSSWWKKPISLP